MKCSDCSKSNAGYEKSNGDAICETCASGRGYFICPTCSIVFDIEDDPGTGFCKEHS